MCNNMYPNILLLYNLNYQQTGESIHRKITKMNEIMKKILVLLDNGQHIVYKMEEMTLKIVEIKSGNTVYKDTIRILSIIK